jgi:hypothetical protein
MCLVNASFLEKVLSSVQKVTSHLLLARVVNSIFMTCIIIRPRKGQGARFTGAWIYALTFVRALLENSEVALTERPVEEQMKFVCDLHQCFRT